MTEEIKEPKDSRGHSLIRWNIIEDPGYLGDEFDNWEHMSEDERFEYFKEIFTYFKALKDFYEKHSNKKN